MGSLVMAGIVDSLTNLSEASFHQALGQLSSSMSSADSVRLVVDVASVFGARKELGERVQADRIHAILRRLELTEKSLSDLALLSRTLSPGIRNAIAGFLSPVQRRQLLGQLRGVERHVEPLALSSSSLDSSSLKTEDHTYLAGSDFLPISTDSSFSTVVLFAGPFQDANRQLLAARGFGPLVWSSLDNLESDLEQNTDVCACLVDGSALQTLDVESQKRLFNLLGAYSTFLWIRVEDKYLRLSPDEIRRCLRSARCMREEVPAALFSIQAEGALREREIEDIEAASRALRARYEAVFIPGELSADQAKILMAAAKLHARELQIEGQVELKSLETRFLVGGLSGACTAVLRVNQSGFPIVAKIDDKNKVLDEMRRFRLFIEPWDGELRPRLHFHGAAAVLLFGLVSDQRERSRPAAMLSSRLEALWNDQLFGMKTEEDLVREGEALAEGAENVARRLRDLNSRKPPASPMLPLGNPDVGVFERLAESGIDWGLPAFAQVALLKAKERFRRLEKVATIHGDVTLKNILLRDDRLPHLIDYAGSGPGHPCVDLVRFELALFLGPLRQIESEGSCEEYQSALSVEGCSFDALGRRFPSLHRCHLNLVCLRGCVAARDQALEALKIYNGDIADYQAAKYLVAFQNLGMMERHTGLARATIAALAPEIARW